MTILGWALTFFVLALGAVIVSIWARAWEDEEWHKRQDR